MSLENISEDFLHSSQLDCEIGSYLGVFLMLWLGIDVPVVHIPNFVRCSFSMKGEIKLCSLQDLQLHNVQEYVQNYSEHLNCWPDVPFF